MKGEGDDEKEENTLLNEIYTRIPRDVTVKIETGFVVEPHDIEGIKTMC